MISFVLLNYAEKVSRIVIRYVVLNFQFLQIRATSDLHCHRLGNEKKPWQPCIAVHRI
jgi:hypothetical protein